MDQVDDFYFSALSEADGELLPISDEKYAEGMQLQEVLMSSIAAFDRYGVPNKKRKTEEGSSSSTGFQPNLRKRKIKEEERPPCDVASLKPETFCKICMEEAISASEMFSNPNCSHSFCFSCLREYIGTKIKESNISAVKCPEDGCKGLLEPEHCQEIIPKEVFERWGSALCESMVLGSDKFSYCPFKDCSALLLADVEGEERVKQSECPSCNRMFCAECGVVWHSGFSCEEFQRLGADERGTEDLKLIELVKTKKWKRCPNCKFAVEKTQGCLHITCRCKCEFCYGCGKIWSETHESCSTA